jgi:glycosyltransferase involved in cell wall biosynthesis
MLRSGTHRTLAFIRHLDRRGWDTTVITVEPDGEPVDADLLARVPAGTRVIRTPWSPLTQQLKRMCGRNGRPRPGCSPGSPGGAAAGKPGEDPGWRDWFSRLLLTPDSRLGWVLPGLAAARRQAVDAVYSTSPFASAHLIALLAAGTRRRPWVADFRDPWVENPFRDLRYASLKAWDAWLERRVLRRASRIVCNTPAARQRLARRLPWTAGKTVTLPNGYDSDLVGASRPIRDFDSDCFVMIHAGNFYGPRSPVPFFRGLREAVECCPEVVRRARVVLAGEPTYHGQSIERMAAAAGVADRVHVLGVRPHAEVLARLRGADASIAIGPAGTAGELQVPNKLYESLAVRRPILALATPHSAMASVLTDAVADHLLCDSSDARAIAFAIARMVREGGGFVSRPWSGVDRYDRRHAADGLACLLDDLVAAALPRGAAAPRHETSVGGVVCVP